MNYEKIKDLGEMIGIKIKDEDITGATYIAILFEGIIYRIKALEAITDSRWERREGGIMTLEEVFRSLELKFSSGNDVPVERATITRDEYDVIKNFLN